MSEIVPAWENNCMTEGVLVKLNQCCKKCTSLQCKMKVDSELSECSYGFNYLKKESINIFGFCVKDPSPTRQKSKRIFEFPQCVIPIDIITNYLEYKTKKYREVQNEIENRKDKIINDYVKNEMFKDDFFNTIKEDLHNNLSFLHDYQQINGTIVKNINVLILQKTKMEEITDATLNLCNHEEVAIYFASKMIEEKIVTAKALQDTSWLYRTEENRKFRVHGCVIKYLRMYKFKCDAKKLNVHVKGTNTVDIIRNPKAFSIIPHTLIDNAIKYAPKNSDIYITVNDNENYIDFSINSFGPLIGKDEVGKIFRPFYRSESAKKIEEDGSGFGLFVAQKIAKEHLNTEIEVNQKGERSNSGYYDTTFSIKIPFEF